MRSDKIVRLTMAQALTKYLINQYVEYREETMPYFAGVWSIFGHGNVASLGEALFSEREKLPTYRAHNEQAMAHAAIAFAKTLNRRRAMACTTSIGPGATNMVTAAALAHINRLPVLLLPSDVFANRRPDPVLQQLEDFEDGFVSVNDCFRPVSRYFDRIMRPEQILTALPRAMATFFDPASCGPVTLAICQDVQAEAYDYPEEFFRRRNWRMRNPPADESDLTVLADLIMAAKKPLMIAGGGVHYAEACDNLREFAERTGIPVAETQAGKSALAWDHPQNLGALGVTGTSAANSAAAEADLVIGLGTRLQDFTTGSRALFSNPERILVQVNVAAYDAHKHGAVAVIGDVGVVLNSLDNRIDAYQITDEWQRTNQSNAEQWKEIADQALAAPAQMLPDSILPSDAQVIGAVARTTDDKTIVVCAAGGLPGELHRLWRPSEPNGYHLEYGYSCMGYEIAGGVGVKMAMPESRRNCNGRRW